MTGRPLLPSPIDARHVRSMERHAHFCGVRLIGVESRTVAVYRREKVRPTSVSRCHSVGVFVDAH